MSVIMPAYNAGAFVAAAVGSVEAQTWRSWELVVVDDGSTDGTADVVMAAAMRNPRIRVFQQANAGQAAARNRAIAESRGEWLALLDADDLWAPGKLARQLEIAGQAGVDVVFSDGWIFDGLTPTASDPCFGTVVGVISGEEMFQLLRVSNRLPTPSVMMRRKAVDAVGGFDEAAVTRGWCEDYDLYCRLARMGCSFVGLEERLVYYRRHPAQTSRNRRRMLEAELAVVERHWGREGRRDPVVRLRAADLRRALIEDSLATGSASDARTHMRRIVRDDPARLTLYIQYALLALSPALFRRWVGGRGGVPRSGADL